jgi:3-hydroxyacyl-CoA dehydrogenase/enoyl-CoA hydratase/3-hydroxybutyryl-CoA epimerase
VYFQHEKARHLPAEMGNPPEVRRVGVVGAGVMGAGIAQLAAIKGSEVVVQEVNQSALDAGLARIDDLFRKAVERGLLTPEEGQRKRAGVHGTLAWERFDSVDVVIEAAVEDMEIKRKLFRELEARTRPDAILATNTSALSVTGLQEGLSHPERIAGLHFFNPIHKMPLVEVVRTPATADFAPARLTAWAIALGKTPVQVHDAPGFVVNRVLMPYLNEAVLLVAEGMKIADVDRVMRRFGMPMGPLELLDQIGLDVSAHVARSMQPSTGGRFDPNTAFETMSQRGWLGVKSGCGFYLHKGKSATPNAEVEALLRGQKAGGPTLPSAALLAEARERMVLLMVNEAAMALGEGVAEDAETIDLAMIMGTGWAPHRGGPLCYADSRGPDDVVRVLSGLASRHGRRFEPCPALKQRAEAKKAFRQPILTPA